MLDIFSKILFSVSPHSIPYGYGAHMSALLYISSTQSEDPSMVHKAILTFPSNLPSSFLSYNSLFNLISKQQSAISNRAACSATFLLTGTSD